MQRCLSEDLMTNPRDLVPEVVFIANDTKQGDKIGSCYSHEGQFVLQYYTGNNFGHFVCLMDWEDWGLERCPRFSYYIQDVPDGPSGYLWKLVRVSTKFDWKKVDDGE